MLSTTAYETRKADFLAYKDTLTKEPTGNTKKEYYVGRFDKEGWEFIHTQLETSGTSEEHVPSSVCSCANDCLHSDTNGIYMLTDAQARNLLNHSKVEYVNINTDAYPGTYLINPDTSFASLSCGTTRSQSSSFSTAFMKSSVIAIDILKF